MHKMKLAHILTCGLCAAIVLNSGLYPAYAAKAPRRPKGMEIDRPAFRRSHPTNSFEVLGVAMPPKMTEKRFIERENLLFELRTRLSTFDDETERLWRALLDERQKKALRDLSATNELNMALAKARADQNAAEREWFTNRLAYVAKTVKVGPRRIERYYVDGCYWQGSKAVKSTVTYTERGRVCVEILYTEDGKKHRVKAIKTKEEDER